VCDVNYYIICFGDAAAYAAASPKQIVINYLTYNFSKEHCVLPEDDLRIETCRSVLNVLM
jgi:hypothetical protein